MTTKSMVRALAMVALVSGLAMGQAIAQEGAAAPTIEHNPVTQAPPGQPLTLTATIHSGNGVFQPVVEFRHEGETSWTKVPLLPSGGAVYSATLPGANLTGNFDYYLETYDNDGNGPARAGSPEAPYHVVVASPPGQGGTRQVTAQPAGSSGAPTKAEKGEATEKKSGSMGKTIGGIVGLAVGAAGLGVGIYGWIERQQEINFSNAASPAERFTYQSPIANFTVIGIVGTSVGVVAAGVGAWLLWSGLSSSPSSPTAPAKDEGPGGFSLVPVPGGAMAGYAGRF
jgi:hypothetical protein